MRVEEVDPRDDTAWAAWYAVLDASLEDERPGEPHWSSLEQREISRSLVTPGGDRTGVLLAARDDHGALAGVARLALPLRENRSLGQVLLHVAPDRRRRGTGTRLLRAVEQRLRAAGRTSLVAEVDEPAPGAPGPAFAAAVGAVCGLQEVRRDLDLPPDPDLLDRLERDGRAAAAGYRTLTWRGPTPPERLEERALLQRRMSTEVPLGDLPYEEEDWDAPRLAAYEGVMLRQRRTWFTAAAEADGRLVAFTDVGVSLDAPQRAYQWSTLVLPEHRGHRLGTLVKVVVLRELATAFPQARLLTTWNAASNAHMIAVNEALGFRTAGALGQWELRLGEDR